LALRRLVAALTLALTGLTVFILNTRDQAEPQPRQLTSASVAAPSAADVHFAHMMITHHEQAVRMSRALVGKAEVPERIRLIADFIAHDQQREINETNAWLSAWKEQPDQRPATPGAAHGMLTEAQLDGLDRAGTREAAGLFLRLMIEHHEGAITMSRSLLDGAGRNVYIHSLAKHVINEQSAEIDAMRKLLRP
jgi:uncharacterized protein (DUF305 family)